MGVLARLLLYLPMRTLQLCQVKQCHWKYNFRRFIDFLANQVRLLADFTWPVQPMNSSPYAGISALQEISICLTKLQWKVISESMILRAGEPLNTRNSARELILAYSYAAFRAIKDLLGGVWQDWLSIIAAGRKELLERPGLLRQSNSTESNEFAFDVI